jgi:hypothetical protein
MLLLATATGPGLVAVGVASRLFDAAAAMRDPPLVAMAGFGEAVEGPIVIDESRCVGLGDVDIRGPVGSLMRQARLRQMGWRRRARGPPTNCKCSLEQAKEPDGQGPE